MSSERVVQAAAYTALTGDATYAALVTGVYDGSAPPGTAYPYTVIGETTEVPDHVMEAEGWENTLTFHDFTAINADGSGSEGKKKLQEIREARNDVLHRGALSVSGFGLTQMLYEWGTIRSERDDEMGKQVFHQVTRYRVRSLATS